MGKSVGKFLDPFRGKSYKDTFKQALNPDPRENWMANESVIHNPVRNTRDLLGWGDEGGFKGFDRGRFNKPTGPTGGPAQYGNYSGYVRPPRTYMDPKTGKQFTRAPMSQQGAMSLIRNRMGQGPQRIGKRGPIARAYRGGGAPPPPGNAMQGTSVDNSPGSLQHQQMMSQALRRRM